MMSESEDDMAPAVRMAWVLESLHDSGEKSEDRLTVPIPDMILWSKGRPVRWMFTSKDSGALMRRHSHRLTMERMLHMFTKHALKERVRTGSKLNPVALALVRGAYGAVQAQVLSLDEVSRLLDTDRREEPRRNLLVLQVYERVCGHHSSAIGGEDAVYCVQYAVKGQHFKTASGGDVGSDRGGDSMVDDGVCEERLHLAPGARIRVWQTSGWPDQRAVQLTRLEAEDSFRRRQLSNCLHHVVRRLERVHDVRVDLLSCFFMFNATTCKSSLVQVHRMVLQTDPRPSVDPEPESRREASRREVHGEAQAEQERHRSPVVRNVADQGPVPVTAVDEPRDQATHAAPVRDPRPVWRPSSAHADRTATNRRPASSQGSQRRGHHDQTRPSSTQRPRSAAGRSTKSSRRRDQQHLLHTYYIAPGSTALASTQGLVQSASAPLHDFGRKEASAAGRAEDGLRRAATEQVLPARDPRLDPGHVPSGTRCCGDFCSQTLEAALGLGGGEGGNRMFQLPFKSVLCARAEEAVVGEPFLGAVAAQCLVMAREDALSSQPDAQALAQQCLGLARLLREGGEAPAQSSGGDEAAGAEGGGDGGDPLSGEGDIAPLRRDEATAATLMSGAAEEAVRLAVDRRFSQLESAWKSEALVNTGGDPASAILVEPSKAHLREGVAPLALWEKEDAARAVCYMSALSHLHPARYYRPRPVCASCFVIYSSFDEQRAVQDRQRSNERQVIAKAALVADRRHRHRMPAARHALDLRRREVPALTAEPGKRTVAEQAQDLLGRVHGVVGATTRTQNPAPEPAARSPVGENSQVPRATGDAADRGALRDPHALGLGSGHPESQADVRHGHSRRPLLQSGSGPPTPAQQYDTAYGAQVARPSPVGIPAREAGPGSSPSVLDHTSLSLARDKSPIRSRSPSGSPFFEAGSGRPVSRSSAMDEPTQGGRESRRLPVDMPLPRGHAKALFKFVSETTSHILGAWDHQAFHLPPEEDLQRPGSMGLSKGSKKKKKKTKPVRRITESQLTYALRRWRLRRAQSHRRVENEKLIRRVLGALEACNVTVMQWVDALQARHRLQHVRPIGGHRRARGKRWHESENDENDDALGQLELLQGLKQLADVASKHPGDPHYTYALLSASSAWPQKTSSSEGWDRPRNRTTPSRVYESSWVLLPEEAERFVYLLLRYRADLASDTQQEAPSQVSATTLIETRVLRDFLLSCEKADSEMLSTEKEMRELDEAFLWLDGYLRVHQLKAGNLLREINMADGIDQGVFVDQHMPKERNMLQPGSIADQKKWKAGTIGQFEASVSLAEFLTELCPRETKPPRPARGSKAKGHGEGGAARPSPHQQGRAAEARKKSQRAVPGSEVRGQERTRNTGGKEARRKARKAASTIVKEEEAELVEDLSLLDADEADDEDLRQSQRIDRIAVDLLDGGQIMTEDGLMPGVGTNSIDAVMDGGFLTPGALDFAADLLTSALHSGVGGDFGSDTGE